MRRIDEGDALGMGMGRPRQKGAEALRPGRNPHAVGPLARRTPRRGPGPDQGRTAGSGQGPAGHAAAGLG